MIWPTAMDSEGRTPVQFFGEQLSRPEPGLFVYAPGVALGDIDGSSKYRSRSNGANVIVDATVWHRCVSTRQAGLQRRLHRFERELEGWHPPRQVRFPTVVELPRQFRRLNREEFVQRSVDEVFDPS
jgi:hypothetical protein